MPGLIVHEWAALSGGSENVVEQMLRAFPDADLQVLWNDAPNRFPTARETWLAHTPLRKHKALALPLLPITWRTVKAGHQPDWLLASSHLFAHHVRPRDVRRETPKYSYIHTPARYIWEPDLDQRGSGPLVRAVGSLFKGIDRRRAQESVKLAANSEFTRQRIQRVWGRDAEVIYPPVDVESYLRDPTPLLTGVERELLNSLPNTFLLGASRLVPYKRLDAVIDFAVAVGMPAVIAGTGPEEQILRHRAQKSRARVMFIGRPSQPLLSALYRRAAAYVFLAVEDFGITPVEAMAAGTPVIVRREGGAAESVIDGVTGAHLPLLDADAYRAALAKALSVSRSAGAERAQTFAEPRFRADIRAWIGSEA
jgi:glycosyltransferase involved in cell wall biosynthesis